MIEQTTTPVDRSRMRIAYFSPLNPCASGISDYSEELLPALSELADVELFVDGYEPSNPQIRSAFPVYDHADFDSRKAERPYSLILYQMGNSLYHAGIYRMMFRHPGVVVLHDVVLHHFALELARRDRNPSIYLRELAFAGGTEAIDVGLAALRNECAPPLFQYSLTARVVSGSLGVIVHSEFARQDVLKRACISGRQVAFVPAHIRPSRPVTSHDRVAIRNSLGLPPTAFVYGAFGRATPAKRLDVALRAFGRLNRLCPESRLLIVGEVVPERWLDQLIHQLDLSHAVVLAGSLPFEAFCDSISAADVCLNLRYPTAGETSASLLRVMAAGVPAIVSGVDSFAELPDNCCCKIPVDDSEEDSLFETMKRLFVDDNLRAQLGAAGKSMVVLKHSPDLTARSYLSVCESILEAAASSPGGDGTTVHSFPTNYASPPVVRRRPSPLSVALEEAMMELGLTGGL